MIELQKKIIDFMRAKDANLFDKTNVHLYDDEDYEDVLLWDDFVCEYVIDSLNPYGDWAFCPQCRRVESLDLGCDDCGYGKRHGRCAIAANNRYDIVRNALPVRSISLSIPTEEEYAILGKVRS